MGCMGRSELAGWAGWDGWDGWANSRLKRCGQELEFILWPISWHRLHRGCARTVSWTSSNPLSSRRVLDLGTIESLETGSIRWRGSRSSCGKSPRCKCQCEWKWLSWSDWFRSNRSWTIWTQGRPYDRVKVLVQAGGRKPGQSFPLIFDHP